MTMTARKRKYAEARMAGMSMKDAAIAAGCPEKTARQAGSRDEKDPDVIAMIARAHSADVVETIDDHAPDQPAAMPAPVQHQPEIEVETVAEQEEATKAFYIPKKADDPLDFFREVMNDLMAEPKLRLDAAKALAAFTVLKPSEKGKKEMKQDAAKQTVGRFGLRAVK